MVSSKAVIIMKLSINASLRLRIKIKISNINSNFVSRKVLAEIFSVIVEIVNNIIFNKTQICYCSGVLVCQKRTFSQSFELPIMGAAGSHLTKRIRRFNVVERTERVINKDKPIPAPLHKADAERLKYLLENDPHLKEELANKNSTLGKNLQSVYVTSKGDLPDVYPQSKTKLPQNRAQEFNTAFTFQEPENVPPGRYTLTQITECIADHYKDKEMYSSQVLADRVKIDKKLMDNILKYYRIFDMYIPEKMMEKKTSNKFFISSAIAKIRHSLEIDKYKEERKQIGKD